jgi:hypothetical protein
MRNTFFSLAFIGLFSLSAIFFVDRDPISLEEAANKGAEFIWQSNPESEFSTHYGTCISLEASNPGKKGMRVQIPAGLWVHPSDSSQQSMILTDSRILALYPGQKREINLYAMCGQHADAAPVRGEAFAMGNMAGEDLQKLTRFIDRKKYQNSMGQSAIWVMTDDMPISSIEGSNPLAVKTLREFCAEAKGLEYVHEESSPYRASFEIPKPSSEVLNGKLSYQLHEDALVSAGVFNSEGEMVQVWASEQLQQRGFHEYEFILEIFDLESGPYEARVLVDGSIYERTKLPLNDPAP